MKEDFEEAMAHFNERTRAKGTTKSVQHTPGPWHFGVHNGKQRTDGSDWGADGLWTKDKKLILGTGPGWDGTYQSPKEADACLIAAAPDLLDAVKMACIHAASMPNTGDLGEPNWPYIAEQLRAAIAKAEGK